MFLFVFKVPQHSYLSDVKAFCLMVRTKRFKTTATVVIYTLHCRLSPSYEPVQSLSIMCINYGCDPVEYTCIPPYKGDVFIGNLQIITSSSGIVDKKYLFKIFSIVSKFFKFGA